MVMRTEDAAMQEEGEHSLQTGGRAGDEGSHGCESTEPPGQVCSTPATRRGDQPMSMVYGTSVKQRVPWRMDESS